MMRKPKSSIEGEKLFAIQFIYRDGWVKNYVEIWRDSYPNLWSNEIAEQGWHGGIGVFIGRYLGGKLYYRAKSELSWEEMFDLYRIILHPIVKDICGQRAFGENSNYEDEDYLSDSIIYFGGDKLLPNIGELGFEIEKNGEHVVLVENPDRERYATNEEIEGVRIRVRGEIGDIKRAMPDDRLFEFYAWRRDNIRRRKQFQLVKR